MPNRILRDWTNSLIIDELSAEAEQMFVRLIMKADDFGQFFANPKLLKANLFPLKEVSIDKIIESLNELVSAGIVVSYSAEGKDFLKIKDFNQRLRTMNSKFPNFEDGTTTEKKVVPEGKLKEEVKEPPKAKPKAKKVPGIQAVYPFPSEKFAESWDEWKEYKAKEHNFKFKATISEGKALQKLKNISNGSEETALLIIEQSIAEGWSGLFPLKNQNYSNNGNTNSNQKASASQQIDNLKSGFGQRLDESIKNFEH